jgi:hypothetical protein
MRGCVDIVKADHRNVFGHTQSRIAKCTHRADRRNIVEGKQCRKTLAGREQFLCGDVTFFRTRRPGIFHLTLQLNR